ncbi:hypothetical protein EVA_07645 [gut metagenome]|uniref:Uncharacterized protein n=1 Tax=gut metagenome TaxID=749906 RepID=J9GPC1_9ZZZZ
MSLVFRVAFLLQNYALVLVLPSSPRVFRKSAVGGGVGRGINVRWNRALRRRRAGRRGIRKEAAQPLALPVALLFI